MAFNKVMLTGRFTKDIELKTTAGDKSVLNATIACNRDFNNEVDFIDIVAWQQTAEFISKYFSKGSEILIEGRLQVRNYEDGNGNKRNITEVVVEKVHFVDKKADNDANIIPENTKNLDVPPADDDELDDDLPF